MGNEKGGKKDLDQVIDELFASDLVWKLESEVT